MKDFLHKFTSLLLLTYKISLFIVLFIGCKNQSSIEQRVTPDMMTEAEISTLAKKIHKAAFILDAHADIVTPSTSNLYLGADGKSKVALHKLHKGGMGAVIMCIAVDPGERTEAAEAEARIIANQELQIVLDLIADSEGEIVLATSAAELIEAQEASKTAFLLGFQNARALEKSIDTIDEFYRAGVRVFALTHIGNNDFADSSRPAFDGSSGTYEAAEHGGLSDLGSLAVLRLNHLGALVDVSQLSKQATLQVLSISQAPIIATHSNVRTISDVSRNLSDEEIDMIGENGGVIHLSPFRAYLKDYSDENFLAEIRKTRRAAGISEDYSYPFELYWEIEDPKEKMRFLMAMSDLIGPAYVTDFVDHIDYVVDRIGIDHAGIGSDFNHGSGVEGFQEASDALNVTTEMVRRGYSQEDIEKVWSGNFLRVLAQAEALRKQD